MVARAAMAVATGMCTTCLCLTATTRRAGDAGPRVRRPVADGGVRGALRRDRRQLRLRHDRPPVHARVRRDARAAREDRRRPALQRVREPGRHLLREADHGRRRPGVADRRRPAAHARDRDDDRWCRGRPRHDAGARAGAPARPGADPRRRRAREPLVRDVRARPHDVGGEARSRPGVRDGGRGAFRHRSAVGLRLLHDHRAAHARGRRVLRRRARVAGSSRSTTCDGTATYRSTPTAASSRTGSPASPAA